MIRQYRVHPDPSATLVASILSSIVEIGSISATCFLLGIEVEIVRRWRARDPKLNVRVQDALVEYRVQKALSVSRLVASGLPINQACKAHGVKANTMNLWRKNHEVVRSLIDDAKSKAMKIHD